ncbi:DUF2645 family protein [Pectobacterium versatile]|nr:DUF2645 family protein [Pectobacterium versatile]
MYSFLHCKEKFSQTITYISILFYYFWSFYIRFNFC